GIRLLYYRRLRVASVVGAVVILLLWFLRLGNSDPLIGSASVADPGLFLFAVIPLCAAGLAVHLWRRRPTSVSQLRLLGALLLGLCAVALGYLQFSFLAFPVPGGLGGPEYASLQLRGANAVSMLFWFIAIANYGVLVPDDWRHVLAAVAGLALISLAATLAAGGVQPLGRAPPPLPLLPVVLP